MSELENYIGIKSSEMEEHSFTSLNIYQFILKIPFEAINAFDGETIMIDVDKNLNKFINKHHRILYYEKNLVTNTYLKHRSFNTKLISGYVEPPHRDWKEMGTHFSIIVTMDGKDYIIDIGFGQFPSQPIPLDGIYVYDEDDIYRIIPSSKKDITIYKLQSKIKNMINGLIYYILKI